MGTKSKYILGLELDEGERAIVNELHARRKQLVKYDQTLEMLLKSWQQLISEVEAGYGMSIYDYTNDVSSRQVLEELLPECPERVRARLLDLLMPLDERYIELTEAPRLSESCPNLPGIKNDQWSRIPIKAVGQLLDDLIAYGFRESR